MEIHSINIHVLGQPHTSDFNRCDYCAAQMKHTVLYGSVRTGDYLIMVIKKSQRAPFPGRHDCRWTAACRNETEINGCACKADCHHLISV